MIQYSYPYHSIKEDPLKGLTFLKYIWRLQPDGYFFLAVRKGDRSWHEISLTRDQVLSLDSLVIPTEGDLYFCPNAFELDARQKHLTLPSRVLYQDLDESDPRELPIVPELWWETSPGRFQCIWVLDQAVEPEELAQLNRALNRACHADPGTWNLTRLLRVPGSYNGKRDCEVSEAYFGKPREAVA